MEAYSDEYHRVYGAHSNIPPCCIEFFVAKFPHNEGSGCGYVQCNNCVTRGRVSKIHACSYDCYDTLRSFGLSNEKAIRLITANVITGQVPYYKNSYITSYTMEKVSASRQK